MSWARGQFQKKREHGQKDRISERKDELKRYVRHDSDLVGLIGDLGKDNFLGFLDGAISLHVAISRGKQRKRIFSVPPKMKTMSPGHLNRLEHRIGTVSDAV